MLMKQKLDRYSNSNHRGRDLAPDVLQYISQFDVYVQYSQSLQTGTMIYQTSDWFILLMSRL